MTKEILVLAIILTFGLVSVASPLPVYASVAVIKKTKPIRDLDDNSSSETTAV